MLRQPEPSPYVTFRASHRQHILAPNPINCIINGLADYAFHKQKFLNRVKTKLDNYQYRSETLEVELTQRQGPTRRSNSHSYRKVETIPINVPTAINRNRPRLKSLGVDPEMEARSSPMPLIHPLHQPSFLEKAMETITRLPSRRQPERNLQTIKRQVAPYRLLKRRIAEDQRKQLQKDRQQVSTRHRGSMSGRRFSSSRKVQHVSRLDSLEGWDTHQHQEFPFL